ncbi:hypothetical protein GGR52DRAFT_201218 [Hypoxylon sp. FL1284]|nr:hypothetical protein GGR52DRAFT_201218 [Hypoxylon sp. FL1284]
MIAPRRGREPSRVGPVRTFLGYRGDSRGGRNFNLSWDFAVGSLLRAVAGYVTGLAALVAGLADRVERTTVGCRAVSGYVAQFPAGVAFHGLCLAVARKVVRPAALVARSRPGATGKAAPAEAGVSAARDGSAAAHRYAGRVGASSG